MLPPHQTSILWHIHVYICRSCEVFDFTDNSNGLCFLSIDCVSSHSHCVCPTAPPIYYVPVLRAADNCTPPQLTPPCTFSQYHLHQATLSDDRGTPMIGQAFAGPMSPAQVYYWLNGLLASNLVHDRNAPCHVI